MSTTTEGPRPLRELVTAEDVANLLVGRSPRLLTDPNRKVQIEGMIAGTVAEVAAVVGDPPPLPVLALAKWAITLGAASTVEDSLFPEQQNGDDGRASRLSVKYLSVLAQLRSDPASSGVASSAPRGSFPPPEAWPDPSAPVVLQRDPHTWPRW